jgi:hypothetical protein
MSFRSLLTFQHSDSGMRLRFSIRDLLWLTALVAVLVAWSLDHSRLYEPARKWNALYQGVPPSPSKSHRDFSSRIEITPQPLPPQT